MKCINTSRIKQLCWFAESHCEKMSQLFKDHSLTFPVVQGGTCHNRLLGTQHSRWTATQTCHATNYSESHNACLHFNKIAMMDNNLKKSHFTMFDSSSRGNALPEFCRIGRGNLAQSPLDICCKVPSIRVFKPVTPTCKYYCRLWYLLLSACFWFGWFLKA